MVRDVLGSLLLLGGALWLWLGLVQAPRRQLRLLEELAASLEQMASAIRFRRETLLRLLAAQRQRPLAGPYYGAVLAALEEAGKLGEVNAIHLGDLSCISMDYMDRFTVKLDYDADFAYELQLLEMSIASDKIQDNMTGTFDMRQREDGSIHFRQNVRG